MLEGRVGKNNLVLTYWVNMWLLSEWKHWLLASAEDSCLMDGAFLWGVGLWHLPEWMLVIPVPSTLPAELLCNGEFSLHCNGESKLPHCFWRGLTRLLSRVCFSLGSLSTLSLCSSFKSFFSHIFFPSLLLVCCPQWNVVCSDVQFAT